MTWQPTLVGPSITLRPLAPADWDDLCAVASDPLIWEQHPNHDRWQEPVFREFFATALASGGALVAVDDATGEIIGSSRYAGHKPDESEVEIGYTFLARRYWGTRTNHEMKRLMLAHAFTIVDRVVFLIGPNNIRSRRAVERIGGVQIADRINAIGNLSAVYEITREAFASGPLATPRAS
jgi:N-acetyltransferase